MAITKVSKAMFDPIALPKESIGFLFKAEVIPTTVSGKEVEVAIRRKVMVYPERLKYRAILEDDPMNRPVLLIRKYELMNKSPK